MRSLFSEDLRDTVLRSMKMVGGGLITLLISAVLISMRILISDDTDLIWDHPSMFFDIVRLAYEPSSRSEWGPLWDILFAVVPMWIYATAIAPGIWAKDEDDLYRNHPSPYSSRPRAVALREPAPPALEWGYEEYSVTAAPPPVIRSRVPTLPGFPCVRPPAEPAKQTLRSADEVDDSWDDL